MPEYLAPGIYVEEVSSGVKSIEGVSTSTVGFLGLTERGPIGVRCITGFTDYQRIYGGFSGTKFLPDAVKGFFDNGGRRAFVSRRVAENDKVAVARLPDAAGFAVEAIGPGDWGRRLRMLVVETGESAGERRLRLLIDYYDVDIPDAEFVNPITSANLLNGRRPSKPAHREDYSLALDPGKPANVDAIINGRSNLIRITGAATGDLHAITEEAAGKPDTKWITFQEGAAPSPLPEMPWTSPWTYLEGIGDISLVVAPDDVENADVTGKLIASCEKLKNRVVLLSAPPIDRPGDEPSHGQNSSYAAFYYPWIKVMNPLDGAEREKSVPPIGHIAGIYARKDITGGAHSTPANEEVLGAIGLTVSISEAVQERLSAKGVNCIRDFRSAGRGIVVWGARTTSSDPEWKYLPVRRLSLFIEKSIEQGIQWVVFEPNDERTWAAVRSTIADFLIGVWRSGALTGNTPEQAFFVKCDRTTMTQDDILNGRLICLIGVAPVRPAEFVILRIGWKTLEAEH
jgi:phage tail sheath protein FI